jgi:hypothetical protein
MHLNASVLYMLSGINAMNISNQNASALQPNGLLTVGGYILGGDIQKTRFLNGLSGIDWNSPT